MSDPQQVLTQSNRDIAQAAIMRALAETEGRAEAADLLETWARRRSALREALIERFRPTLLEDVCWDAVQGKQARIRRAIRTMAAEPEAAAWTTANQREREMMVEKDEAAFQFIGRMERAVNMMANWTLPSGAVIMQATGLEVRDAAKYETRIEKTAREKRMFYESVAAVVPENDQVNKHLTAEQVYGLLCEARASCAP